MLIRRFGITGSALNWIKSDLPDVTKLVQKVDSSQIRLYYPL